MRIPFLSIETSADKSVEPEIVARTIPKMMRTTNSSLWSCALPIPQLDDGRAIDLMSGSKTSRDGELHTLTRTGGRGENLRNSEDGKPIFHGIGHGPKMGPKLRETSVRYDNKQPEMIENARTGKVN